MKRLNAFMIACAIAMVGMVAAPRALKAAGFTGESCQGGCYEDYYSRTGDDYEAIDNACTGATERGAGAMEMCAIVSVAMTADINMANVSLGSCLFWCVI